MSLDQRDLGWGALYRAEMHVHVQQVPNVFIGVSENTVAGLWGISPEQGFSWEFARLLAKGRGDLEVVWLVRTAQRSLDLTGVYLGSAV